MEKIQNDFDDGASQWAKDKQEVQQLQKSSESKQSEQEGGEKKDEKASSDV